MHKRGGEMGRLEQHLMHQRGRDGRLESWGRRVIEMISFPGLEGRAKVVVLYSNMDLP